MMTAYITGTTTGNLVTAVICRGRKGTGTKMVIVASNSMNVQNWLFEYLEPYQARNYAFYLLEREKDFIEYASNLDTVMVFVEDIFFGEKTIGKLDYYRKLNPKLQFVLFSASQLPLNVQQVICDGAMGLKYPAVIFRLGTERKKLRKR